jgi:ankyrin repeat protein
MEVVMIALLLRNAAIIGLVLLGGPVVAGGGVPIGLVWTDAVSAPAGVRNTLALFEPGSRLSADGARRGHPLHWAALQNQVESVETLVDRGMAVDDRDEEGRTPLMTAAAFGSVEVAELLLVRGADAKARDTANGDTPLHFAALSGGVAVAKLLIAHGAEIGAGSAPACATPLHYAAVFGQLRMIEFLVANGADPNVRDIEGMGPFQYASRRNRTLVMDLLVQLGGRPDNLFEAVNAGDLGRVIALVNRGADVNQPDLFGTPLHRAASNGHVAIMVALIDAGADLEAIGEPAMAHPLHAAALTNQAEAEALLIGRGASVDARDAGGRTPLMVAASFGNVDAAAALLAHGADPRAVDISWMDTPIHYAAYAGSVEIAELLLAYGADLNARSGNNGATAVHRAATGDKPAMIEYLAAQGADLNLRDTPGLTPYQLASKGSGGVQVVELLRQLGAHE